MIRQRLTILRDLPVNDALEDKARETFRIFRSRSTGLYFVDNEGERGWDQPVFGAHFDSLFQGQGNLVPETVESFFSESSRDVYRYHYFPEIVQEAIDLSEMFQTLVLSYYGDDEGTDFVAVAEKGKLLRLRCKGDRQEIRRLSEEEARSVETEIHAERLSPDGEGGVEVFEYALLEGLYSGAASPEWSPNWRYIEGEIGRRVVFRSLWHAREDFPSDQMFRNAYLEFRETFGSDLKDPYYEPEDYELVTQVTVKKPRRPLWPVISNHVGRFLKRHPLSTGFVAVILIAGLFFERDETTSTANSFRENCEIVGGVYREDDAADEVSPGSGKRCEIGGELYARHELPSTGNVPVPVAVFLSTESCEPGVNRLCPALDGKVFAGEIAGFTFEPGRDGILVLDRQQLCDQISPGQCSDGSPAFEYSLRRTMGMGEGS